MNTMKLLMATFSVTRRRLRILPAVIGLMSISLARGQEKPGRLTFDVAAIRPSQSGVRGGLIKPLPGGDGCLVQNLLLKDRCRSSLRISLQ